MLPNTVKAEGGEEPVQLNCTYAVDGGSQKFFYLYRSSPIDVKFGAESSWATGHNLYAAFDETSKNTLVFGTSSSTYEGKGVYTEFTASIAVPARQEYVVNYNMNFSSVRGNYIDSGMGFELFDYGYSNDTVTAPTAKTVSDAAMAEDPSKDLFIGYSESRIGTSVYDPNGIKPEYSVFFQYSSGGDGGVVGTKDIQAVYANKTDAPQTFTQRFGLWTGLGYGSSNPSTINGQCIITPTLVSEETLFYSAPKAVTVEYDGTDMLNPLSTAITSADWYVDGGMVFSCADTVKESGTYTVTASLSNAALNDGVQWLLGDGTKTTDDQTFTFTVTPIVITSPKNSVITTEYNGAEQSLKTLADKPAWYDQSVYSDPSIIEINDKFTDAGSSTVNVKLVSGNYAWSDGESNSSDTRSFTFKITAKPLSVIFEEQNGLTVARFEDESQIYGRDTGDKYPKLKTKYYQPGDSPNSAVESPTRVGQWIALAALENAAACNYSVNAVSDEFTVSKIVTPYPVLTAGGSATVPYNGNEQEFVFEGYDGEIMEYVVPEGAISFDGATLTVKDAGEYAIEYRLKDESLYEWSGGTGLSISVEKKKIVIVSDESNATEWSKGADVELKFRVTGLVTGDSVKLEATYSKGGSGTSKLVVTDNGDGTQSVTIPKGYGTGDYVLTVKTAEVGNYIEREAATHSFRITAEGLDLGENEIKWKIDGKSYTIEDCKDGYLELEYTGKAFSLTVDINSSASAAELEIESYGGDWQTAINAGEYTATVHIVASDPNLYSFDETYTLKIRIVPKVLDFSEATWEWQYAGDSDWQALKEGSMPSFDNRAVTVRISPEYFAGIGLKDGEYTVEYRNNNDLTEKGEKSTTAEITISNGNYTTADGGYAEVSKQWEITAKSLEYNWTGKQTVTAGENTFEFAAIEFADGGDYSGFFEYYFTVDGEEGEFTKEELEAYISEHWTETTAITGKVYVRQTVSDGEVVISPSYRSFTTGTPKTALTVAISCEENAEYGKVNFGFEVKRGNSDERTRTEVRISGGALEEEVVFAGDSSELTAFINGLGAGEYKIKVTVTVENSETYVVTGDNEYRLIIAKRKVELPTLKEGITYNGGVIYFKDCIEGYDDSIMTILGESDGGIDSGTDWREQGYYTKIRLIDGDNYEFGEGVSEYEYNWHIGKFIITEDTWNKSGKEGAYLDLPDWVKGLLRDSKVLKLEYSYYLDQYSDALESVEFVKGSSLYVDAKLSGSAAVNFEFENGSEEDGVQTSAKTLYTVPKGSGAGEFFEDIGEFVKGNYWVVIVIGIGLLLLILIIVLVSRRRRRADDDYYDEDYDYDDDEDYDYDDDEEDDEDEEEDYDDDY